MVVLRRVLQGGLCGVQHIFDKNTVTRRGVVDENVRYRTHQLAVLNDGAARHECGQVGTTVFNNKLKS